MVGTSLVLTDKTFFDIKLIPVWYEKMDNKKEVIVDVFYNSNRIYFVYLFDIHTGTDASITWFHTCKRRVRGPLTHQKINCNNHNKSQRKTGADDDKLDYMQEWMGTNDKCRRAVAVIAAFAEIWFVELECFHFFIHHLQTDVRS